MGDVEGAISDYDRALSLSPNDARLHFNRGFLYMQRCEFELAVENLDRVLHLARSDHEAFRQRGRARPVLGDFKALAELCGAEILPARNVKVLSFAAANLGRQVDRGECWDLAANPVKASGGKVQGYDFGDSIPWEQGKPGDVVTFGTGGSTGGHVMVLFRWARNRSTATILHQNVGGVRKVMLDPLGGVESSKAGQPFALRRP
jgi:hypothetical protein